ncbi:phage protein Gp27 family protein [Rhizobium sp. 18055]|uniref:phage protein Gp27 family protein n=1 Tax=Rhizobium sp. 18055 TaxID=2681403 RepID=UPI00135A8965|nr:phage protein Gp27 family protein [Rhizobium sp. 18055]
MAQGRGRLTAIDQLPEECDAVVSWAAQALADRERTQVEIYGEFKQQLIALQGEQGIAFDIPSFSAFNRYSIKLAILSRRMEQTREIAATLSQRMDAAGSDELTLISAEAIKTLIFEILQAKGEAGLDPKGAMELANALRAASAAQVSSSNRRQKLEAEERLRKVETDMKANAEKALDTLANEPGISKEAIARARREFLGVRPKKKDKE